MRRTAMPNIVTGYYLSFSLFLLFVFSWNFVFSLCFFQLGLIFHLIHGVFTSVSCTLVFWVLCVLCPCAESGCRSSCCTSKGHYCCCCYLVHLRGTAVFSDWFLVSPSVCVFMSPCDRDVPSGAAAALLSDDVWLTRSCVSLQAVCASGVQPRDKINLFLWSAPFFWIKERIRFFWWLIIFDE